MKPLRFDSEARVDLIKKLQSGHKSQFRFIISDYQDMIFRFCFTYVEDHDDAEEITHQVFIKAYKRIRAFRFESKFSTWLFKIAYTTCIDFIRYKTIKLKRMTRIDHEISDETKPNNSDESDRVLKVVLRLNDRYRDIIILYYYQELSQQEIANILGINENNVKILLYRAREQMKQKMNEIKES